MSSKILDVHTKKVQDEASKKLAKKSKARFRIKLNDKDTSSYLKENTNADQEFLKSIAGDRIQQAEEELEALQINSIVRINEEGLNKISFIENENLDWFLRVQFVLFRTRSGFGRS